MMTWAVRGIVDHVVTRDCIVPKNPDGIVRIACCGDSNTAEPGAFFSPDALKWPNYLRSYLGGRAWRIANYGIGGAFITHPFSLAANQTSEGFPLWSWHQMSAAIASSADIAIIAFGTNDVAQAGSSTTFINTIVRGMVDTCTSLRAAGVVPFMCSIPPRFADASSTLLACTSFQALFLATSMHAVKVDFHTGVVSAHEADGIHFEAAGQMLRADRVFRALHANPV